MQPLYLNGHKRARVCAQAFKIAPRAQTFAAGVVRPSRRRRGLGKTVRVAPRCRQSPLWSTRPIARVESVRAVAHSVYRQRRQHSSSTQSSKATWLRPRATPAAAIAKPKFDEACAFTQASA